MERVRSFGELTSLTVDWLRRMRKREKSRVVHFDKGDNSIINIYKNGLCFRDANRNLRECHNDYTLAQKNR